MPGVQFRMRDAVDEQVGVTGFFAGELIGQTPPWQAPVIVVLARLKGRRTFGKGTAHHRIAAFVKHLNVDVILAFALLENVLGGVFTLTFVGLRPLFGQRVEARVAAENPGVLVEHVPEQDGKPCNQSDGQPEAGQDTPEQ